MRNLIKRRTAHDVLFLHKVVHGHVYSELVSSLGFHVPARAIKGTSVFYPSVQSQLSPLMRMQICGNELSPHVDVFFQIFLSLNKSLIYIFSATDLHRIL